MERLGQWHVELDARYCEYPSEEFNNRPLLTIYKQHHYEIFDNGVLHNDIGTHISSACGFGGAMSTNNKWTISGEWTGAMTDCAKWYVKRSRHTRQ
jgi:aryl-phospho-beta-D-glucosidase BglC (GH1 family)